eukprot:scaffold59905_cov74-Phaeocystis_antarctica.AAC.2
MRHRCGKRSGRPCSRSSSASGPNRRGSPLRDRCCTRLCCGPYCQGLRGLRAYGRRRRSSSCRHASTSRATSSGVKLKACMAFGEHPGAGEKAHAICLPADASIDRTL